ncbi:MAG: TldD/PmbA family protein [Lachnospiraceae bacterium]
MLTKEVTQKILETAIACGGDFAEVFVEDKYNTTIIKNNQEVEDGSVARDYGVGIRVFCGTKYVYTYSSNDSEENLLQITKEVCQVFQKNNKSVCTTLSPLETAPILSEKQFSEIPYKQKLEVMDQVVAAGRNYDRAVKRMWIKYLDQEQHIIVANSEGLYKEDNRNKTRMLISSYAEKDGDTQSGYVGPGAMKGFEFYQEIDLDAYGREAAKGACAMAGADYCTAGQMSVVVENGFGGLMFHEACGHSLEASSVAKGNSEFSNRLGQLVASEVVTLVDDGSIPKAWGSLGIDDEGNKTRKNVLIENGVLKGYMIDRLNARIMQMEPTGSGRRESYKYAPTSRMTNTYIAPGKHTREEIFAATNQGLFVKSISAGSVNPVTGDFNFAVAEAYEIKNGKIGKPVKGATLIGKGGEVLQRVDMVGDNLSIGQGYCYAGSGALYIGAGQPTVRISNMTVGGIK